VFTIFREGEFELLNSLGIELKQVLHAEQGYSLRAPLSPSEEIRFTTRISSVVEKKGRSANLAFIAFETDFVRTGDGETVATARSTMVYREGVE
jgi:hydroxyacyl-ACP dehydratase HTD2-like protein with hotdog domain